jgi:hypothetical protein
MSRINAIPAVRKGQQSLARFGHPRSLMEKRSADRTNESERALALSERFTPAYPALQVGGL